MLSVITPIPPFSGKKFNILISITQCKKAHLAPFLKEIIID